MPAYKNAKKTKQYTTEFKATAVKLTHQKGASENTKVVCSKCDRSFFVVPDGGDYKRVLKVVELAST